MNWTEELKAFPRASKKLFAWGQELVLMVQKELGKVPEGMEATQVDIDESIGRDMVLAVLPFYDRTLFDFFDAQGIYISITRMGKAFDVDILHNDREIYGEEGIPNRKTAEHAAYLLAFKILDDDTD